MKNVEFIISTNAAARLYAETLEAIERINLKETSRTTNGHPNSVPYYGKCEKYVLVQASRKVFQKAATAQKTGKGLVKINLEQIEAAVLTNALGNSSGIMNYLASEIKSQINPIFLD